MFFKINLRVKPLILLTFHSFFVGPVISADISSGNAVRDPAMCREWVQRSAPSSTNNVEMLGSSRCSPGSQPPGNPTSAIFSETVTVIEFGADPTGVTDSAPAFTNAIKSDRKIIVPPGTYLFKSSATSWTCSSPAQICASAPAAVYTSEQENFLITGYGATINVDKSIAPSSAFIFYKSNKFHIEGLTINGNRHRLPATYENVGISLFSDVDWTVKDVNFASGFGDAGAALAGDWLLNGHIIGNTMNGTGQCADFAFSENLEIVNNVSIGAGTGMIAGQKCWSFFHDSPNSATNNTGYSIQNSNSIKLSDNYVKNYSSGAVIASGTNFSFTGNIWDRNPGIEPAISGAGILIYYNPTGRFASIGTPPTDIVIDGDLFINNGQAVAGAGVFISCSGITNTDKIKNISIINSTFRNNFKNGIMTNCTVASGRASNFTAYGNIFSGTQQTTTIDNNTRGLLSTGLNIPKGQ